MQVLMPIPGSLRRHAYAAPSSESIDLLCLGVLWQPAATCISSCPFRLLAETKWNKRVATQRSVCSYIGG